ncbi:putative G-protein coupled receptor 148 [Erethizon dorsatum]
MMVMIVVMVVMVVIVMTVVMVMIVVMVEGSPEIAALWSGQPAGAEAVLLRPSLASLQKRGTTRTPQGQVSMPDRCKTDHLQPATPAGNMGSKLALSSLSTTAWPTPFQLLSKTPWPLQEASNASHSLRDMRVPISALRWLLLPSSLLAVATLALSPLLLVTILRSQRLRHQPHYLLLANILLSDLAYILFHTLISSSNLGGWEVGRIVCGILRDGVFAAYISTILSFTATVLHAYLAVTHPLHYLSFLSGRVARKTVALIWLVACFFPTFLLWFAKQQDAKLETQGALCTLPLSLDTKQSHGSLVTITHTCTLCVLFLCAAVITYCFWRIYVEARPSGVCAQGYSRARGTLLVHMVLITLYVGAGVVFSLDVILAKYHHIGASTHTWLLAANSEVFMMLPRAMLPYLYVLRYRQLQRVVRGHFSPRREAKQAIEAPQRGPLRAAVWPTRVAQYTHKGLCQGRKGVGGGQEVRVASERQGDRESCCAAGREDREGPPAKESWQPRHAGKGRRQMLPQVSEGTQPCQLLDSDSGRRTLYHSLSES